MRQRLSILTAIAVFWGGTSLASTIEVISFSDSGSYAADTSISDSSTGTFTQKVSAAAGVFEANQTSLRLGRFDPALGTILSIVFNFTESNTSSSSTSLVCEDSAFGIGTNNNCNRSSTTTTVAVPIQVDIPVDGKDFVDVAQNRTVGVRGDRFNAFLGTGDLLIPWRLNTSHFASGECVPDFPSTITKCDLTSTAEIRATFTASVAYTYRTPPPTPPTPEPVPLPASAWMLLASLGGLAAWRRRKG